MITPTYPHRFGPVFLSTLLLFTGLPGLQAQPPGDPVGPARIAVDGPFQNAAPILVSFSGQESLSQLFMWELDLVAADQPVAAADVLGRAVSVRLDLGDAGQRVFQGIVSRFSQGAVIPGTARAAYRMEVVPQLWLLTRRTQIRTFVDKSYPDIVKAVLAGAAGGEPTWQLARSYPTREYCVQYRESDFDFCSRLMEHEGMFYYFSVEDGRSRLVVSDAAASAPPLPGGETVSFVGGAGDAGVHDWRRSHAIRSSRVTLRDYNFRTPDADLTVQAPTAFPIAALRELEVYDFPGNYAARFDGVQTAETRMQEEDAQHAIVHGTSDVPRITAGHALVLSGHPRSTENGRYVITQVHHRFELQDPGNPAAGWSYQNSFTCIPDGVPYRPQRVTPRPSIAGVESAVVVGPAGEEIFTDKYGRVKVQFHWDREGKKDGASAAWVRVAQPFAGRDRGFYSLPEVGDEVLVTFEHGDPDRPIIVGRVYNANDLPRLPRK